MARWIRVSILAALAGALLALAGCGGGGGGSDDPASLAPADAPVYIQATLRPTGTLKSNTEDAISTVTGESDPGKAITDLIDKQLASPDNNSKVRSYEADIKPWLGERAGLFVDRFQDGDAVFIAQSTDNGAAQDFIDKTGSPPVQNRSYNGTDYRVDSDDTAAAVVDDFVVIGDERALKEAIDASGGDSLADDSTFKDAIGGAPSDSLADTYVSVDAFAKAVQQQVESQNADFAKNIFGDTKDKSALASLIPSADKVEIDFTTNATSSSSSSGDVGSVIGSFPADAWAAAGVPGVGERISMAVDQLEHSNIPGLTPGAIAQQLKAQAGIDLNALTGSLGDLGLFLIGDNLTNFAGAGVITTTDPGAAQDAIANLGRLVQQNVPGISKISGGFQIKNAQIGPQPVIVKVTNDRLIVAYGQKAAQAAAAKSPNTLDGTSLYQDAAASLGSGTDLSGFLDIQKFISISEAVGGYAAYPSFQQAKRYLDHLTFLAFGGGQSGDQATSKAIVGLQK